MPFTVGGDAKNYTLGTNAAFLLLLVHALALTMLVGSRLANVYFTAHVRTATAHYRACTTVRGDTVLHSF